MRSGVHLGCVPPTHAHAHTRTLARSQCPPAVAHLTLLDVGGCSGLKSLPDLSGLKVDVKGLPVGLGKEWERRGWHAMSQMEVGQVLWMQYGEAGVLRKAEEAAPSKQGAGLSGEEKRAKVMEGAHLQRRDC